MGNAEASGKYTAQVVGVPELRVTAGTQAEAVGKGVGLANTARRLEQLYGDRQALTLSNLTGGGLRVAVELPYRAAP